MSIKFSKSFIYSQTIFWGILIGVGSVFLIIQVFREYERQSYQPYISQYTEKPRNEPVDRNLSSPDDIAISGKLMIINLKNNKVDPIFSRLPESLKPDSVEQIKTVLWINCENEETALVYTDGSKGIGNNCRLTFVDIINHIYLWSDVIKVLPPLSKKAGTSAVADPAEEILRYLKKIPHKN